MWVWPIPKQLLAMVCHFVYGPSKLVWIPDIELCTFNWEELRSVPMNWVWVYVCMYVVTFEPKWPSWVVWRL